MPIIDFPNSPTVNQQFTAGGKIWQWSGTTWDVVRIAVPAASLTSTDVSRLTGVTSNIQTQINTLSTNLGNTLDDYVPIGDVGVADGVASLDSSGKIPIAQLGNLIDGAPGALDTLNELAAAINDDVSYAATITTALGLKAPLASPTFTGTVSGIDKTMVGLGNVTNTSDANKPVSTATQTALDLKASLISPTFTGTVTIPSGSAITGVPYLTTANTFTGGVQQITTASAATKGLIVKVSAGQSVNNQEWQSSTGVAETAINGTNRLSVRTTLADAGLNVGTPSAGTVGAIIRGAASQTANLQEWQNSAGSILSKIESNGAITAPSLTLSSTALATTSGGTGLTSYTTGDLLYSSASNTLAKLGAGSNGQILTLAAGLPTWAAAPITLPSQTGNSGKYLTTDGNNASWGIISFDTTSIEIGTIMGAY